MDKKTKIAAAVIVGLLIAIAGVSFLLSHIAGLSWTDKYGFKHNAETNATYEVDANKNRDYAIVELDDKYETLSGHEFIDKITTILNAYSNKIYTTFVFSDGTGLYFPESDINNTAFYGKVDENGIIIEEQKYLYISGTQIEIVEASESHSEQSQNLLSLIPSEYMYDSFYAATDNEGNAYFSAFTSEDNTAMLNELFGYAKEVGCTTAYFDILGVEVHYGYIVTDAGIVQDENAINIVKEFTERQN